MELVSVDDWLDVGVIDQVEHCLDGKEHLAERCKEQVEQELHEVLCIGMSDAVVEPRAMMVHPEDIDLAGGAVVRARRLPAVSLLSMSAGLRLIILTNKRRFESHRYRTCII